MEVIKLKKEKYIELNFKNLKKFSIAAIITGVILLSMMYNVNNNIFIMPSTDNKIIIGLFFVLNLLLLVFSFGGFLTSVLLILFTIVGNTIFSKKAEKLYKKRVLKVQEYLNAKDFSDVLLKKYDPGIIPVEKFVCTAKLDENGNIIYKVSLDYVAQTDDYEKFLKHFDIQN